MTNAKIFLQIKLFFSYAQDEETQVNGIIAIIDMKEFGWAQAKAMSPFYAKKLNSLIQVSHDDGHCQQVYLGTYFHNKFYSTNS